MQYHFQFVHFPWLSSPQALFMLSMFASSLPFPLWVQSSGILSICKSLCWLFAVWRVNVDYRDCWTRVVFACPCTVHIEPKQPLRVNCCEPQPSSDFTEGLYFQLGPTMLLSNSPIFFRNSQPILSPVPQSPSQVENLRVFELCQLLSFFFSFLLIHFGVEWV